MNSTIGILGCGWLGLPLAKSFISLGYQVHGSTTSEEKLSMLEKEGIQPFLIRLSEDKIEGPIYSFLKRLAVLIIDVPPKLKGKNKENFVKKMERLKDAIRISKVRKVLFISSTSVYGDLGGDVTEKTLPRPVTESGKQLWASEDIFRHNVGLQSTFIRFGGLIGPGRHPITLLSGKKGIPDGKAPINLIHLNDAIRIIESVIKNNWWGETFNGVYPLHPQKKDYYTAEAQKRGLPLPDYVDENVKNYRKILSFALINVKKFNFKTSIVD